MKLVRFTLIVKEKRSVREMEQKIANDLKLLIGNSDNEEDETITLDEVRYLGKRIKKSRIFNNKNII